MSENVLAVQAVDVRLSGRQILDQVSFTVAPGEFTGLIGSNGAGKTTLFRVILGLQSVSAGAVLIAGRSRCTRTPTSRLRSAEVPARSRTCR